MRGVAARLAADPRIDGFAVEAENFESIHNHSAYARIARGLVGRRARPRGRALVAAASPPVASGAPVVRAGAPRMRRIDAAAP